MPLPTPAKWTADSSPRPCCASRSSTSAEAKIRVKALAMPATSRSARKTASAVVRPIAARQSALAASEPSSQARREPGRRSAASRAPAR